MVRIWHFRTLITIQLTYLQGKPSCTNRLFVCLFSGHSKFHITLFRQRQQNVLRFKNTMLATNPALYIAQPESLPQTPRSSLQAKRSPIDQRWRRHWAPRPPPPRSAHRSQRRRAFRRCYSHWHSSYFASPSSTARISRSSSAGKREYHHSSSSAVAAAGGAMVAMSNRQHHHPVISTKTFRTASNNQQSPAAKSWC